MRRRLDLIWDRDVNVVLEVGANAGGFSRRLRADGYRGRIVSFEPTEEAFASLAAACASDPAWECMRKALGSSNGTATLNIAGNNSMSSSILEMLPRHVAAAPRSSYVRTETCEVVTLDSLRGDLLGEADRALLKLDVQGFELEVLRGADATLEHVVAIDAELSFVPLYEGAPTVDEVVAYLDERGFGLVGIEPYFFEKGTGRILQINGLFAQIGATDAY